jgi:hypothetical protein
MTLNVQDVTPILNVSNLKESFAWFERLGWQKHWEHGDPPTFGAVISGSTEIFLCQGCQGASWRRPASRALGQSGRQHVDELVVAFTGSRRRAVRARGTAWGRRPLAADRHAMECSRVPHPASGWSCLQSRCAPPRSRRGS